MISKNIKEIFKTYYGFKLRILFSQLGRHSAFALPFSAGGRDWMIDWRRFPNDRPKRSSDRRGWNLSPSGWRDS